MVQIQPVIDRPTLLRVKLDLKPPTTETVWKLRNARVSHRRG